MKLNFVTITLLFVVLGLTAQENVFLKIGDTEVTKDEFKYIFLKNNSDQEISKKSIKEYLNLYTNFKLKVEDAKSDGLDTLPSFTAELSKYRKQLTKPYLTDLSVDKKLTTEAYERLKEEVEVSHILLSVQPDAKKAEQLADSIKRALENNADFATLARKYSKDPSVVTNNGYLGFLKGFRTVYSFETAAYNTPVGEISEPVNTRFGIHVLKVHSRRESPGELLVAHILKLTPETMPKDKIEDVQFEINEIYKKLKKGVDFEDLAKKYSDDSYSAKNGGKLPWFGTGEIIKPFEEAAFALDKGQYSKPIKTNYGFHIIKLIDKRNIGAYEEMEDEIKRKLANDERGKAGVSAKLKQIKEEYKYKKYDENFAPVLSVVQNFRYADSLFLKNISKLTDPLFELEGKAFTQADFGKWMHEHPKGDPSNSLGMDRKYKRYEVETILSYEDSKLEEKYPEFRNLIKEYHDGILLFDISSKKVWNKAAESKEELKSFYNKHKKNYRWEDKVWKGRVLLCRNDSTKETALELSPSLTKEELIKKVNEKGPFLKVIEGYFKKGENNAVDVIAYETGDELNKISEYEIVALDGKFIDEGEIKPFEYSKGAATSDYQDYLEAEWVKNLRKTYNTSLDKKVYKELINELIEN